MSLKGIPTDEPANCDVCKQDTPVAVATAWCDTCSQLLCDAHAAEHPKGHDVAKLDAPGNDDDCEHDKGANTSDSDACGKHCDNNHHNLKNVHVSSVSEERLMDVLSMLEGSSPAAVCKKLVTFLGEDEVAKKTHHHPLAEVYASLRTTCWATVDAFVEPETVKQLLSQVKAESMEKQAPQAQMMAGKQQAQFNLCGDLTLAENADAAKQSEAMTAVAKKLSDFSEELACGVRVEDEQPPEARSELWQFAAGSTKTGRDAIPCDGRVPIPGRAGRRVTLMLFTDSNFKVRMHFAKAAAADAAAATAQKPALDAVEVEAAPGRLLIYLSGAPTEIELIAGAQQESYSLVKYLW